MNTIKIKYHGNDLPKVEIKEGSDWIDLYASETVFVPFCKQVYVPLGISVELPEGYEAEIRPRSSTSDECKSAPDMWCKNNGDDEPDMVNHPKHYCREGAMECFEEFRMIYGDVAAFYACLFNLHKYRYRSGDKNGLDDIYKSDWYSRKIKELKESIGIELVIK